MSAGGSNTVLLNYLMWWKSIIIIICRVVYSQITEALGGLPRFCFGSSVPPHTYMVILWICIEGISCQIPSGFELPNTLRLCQKENLWPGFLCRVTASHNKCQIYRLSHSECLWHELLDFSDNNTAKVTFLLSHTINLSCTWLSGSGCIRGNVAVWCTRESLGFCFLLLQFLFILVLILEVPQCYYLIVICWWIMFCYFQISFKMPIFALSSLQTSKIFSLMTFFWWTTSFRSVPLGAIDLLMNNYFNFSLCDFSLAHLSPQF